MGTLKFYLMGYNEPKEEDFYKAIMQVKAGNDEISHVALNQLHNEKQFNVLKKTNIDYYYCPNAIPKVNINRLKEAMQQGTDFIVRSNISYLKDIKKQFGEIGFTYER